MKKKNRGFTLIELIVTISIIAIFCGVVLSLIATGSGSYRNTSSNAKVQMEAQETLDQLQELIIDANRSVYYAYGSGESLDTMGEAISQSDIDTASSMPKTFLVCNEETLSANADGSQVHKRFIYDVIDWDSGEHKLLYCRKEYEADESALPDKEEQQQASLTSEDGESFGSGEDKGSVSLISGENSQVKDIVPSSVPAENITGFNADVSKVVSDRIVRFQITANVRGKEITTLHTVNLRNDIIVAKPDDAYNNAATKPASITIVDYKSPMEAGTSYILRESILGDVDPATIKWQITEGTENGYFPSEDPTFGKLTLYPKASGSVIVKVSARTKNGEEIESAPVKIIINEAPQEGTMEPDKNPVLLGVDTAQDVTYNLNQIVNWHEVFPGEDSSQEHPLPGTSINWQAASNDGIFVASDGNVTVYSSGGTTGANGQITVTATYNGIDKTYSADITIQLVRSEVSVPKPSYKVGENKPEFSYTYRVGGENADVPNDISLVVLDRYTQDGYTQDGTFTEQESGKTYDVTASKQLGDGQGAAVGHTSFQVEEKEDNAESIGVFLGDEEKGLNTVVAGDTYTCSNSRSGGFHVKNLIPWNYDMVWSVVGSSDPETTFANGEVVSDGAVYKYHELKIGKNETGFRLTLQATVNDDSNASEYYGFIDVKVVTEIRIKSPSDVLKVGETAVIMAEARISNEWVDITDYYGRGFVGDPPEEGYQDPNPTWTAGLKDRGKDFTVRVQVRDQDTSWVVRGNTTGTVVKFYLTKKVTVPDPVKFEVRELNNKLSAITGDTLSFWLYVEVDGKVYDEPDSSFTINWDNDSVIKGNNASPGQANRQTYVIENTNSSKITAKATMRVKIGGQDVIYTDSYDVAVSNLIVKISGEKAVYLAQDEVEECSYKAAVFERTEGGEQSGDKNVTSDKYPIAWELVDEKGSPMTYTGISINKDSGWLSIEKDSIAQVTKVIIKAYINKPNLTMVSETYTVTVYPGGILRDTIYVTPGENVSLPCNGINTAHLDKVSIFVHYTDGTTANPSRETFKDVMNLTNNELPEMKVTDIAKGLETISYVEMNLSFQNQTYIYTIIPKLDNLYDGYRNGGTWTLYDTPKNGVFVPSPEVILMTGKRKDAYTYEWPKEKPICRIRQSSSSFYGRGDWVIQHPYPTSFFQPGSSYKYNPNKGHWEEQGWIPGVFWLVNLAYHI